MVGDSFQTFRTIGERITKERQNGLTLMRNERERPRALETMKTKKDKEDEIWIQENCQMKFNFNEFFKMCCITYIILYF